MTRTRPSPRPGFTMIELLVVIGLIIVLASMLVLISPRFAEDQRTTRGADQIQGWLLVAKQRAYRDQLPRGVRLVLGANNQVTEIMYIERPEDLRGEPDPDPNAKPKNDHNHIQVPIPVAPYNGLPPTQQNSFVFIPGWDLKSNDLVLPGDFLKINTYETQPYNIHRIFAVNPPGFPIPPPGGTVLQLAAEDTSPSLVVPGGSIAIDADTRYQIIRQARPMAGEPNLPLPRDVIIDLGTDQNKLPYSILPANPTFVAGQLVPLDGLDIMFNQRGLVMGSNANGGKIILRVRQGDKPDTYGEQIYIVVHTRTGLLTAHPVNLSDPLDPFKFTRDAKDSGM